MKTLKLSRKFETLQSLLSLNNKSYPGKRKDMRFPGFLTLFDKQNINTGIFEDSHAVKQEDGLMDNLLDKLSNCNNPSENNIRHFILTFITYVQDAVSIPITPLRNHNLHYSSTRHSTNFPIFLTFSC